MQAVREVWRNLLPLLSMKLYFEGAAVLWGFIPIYGIIKGIRHRLHWAMASNVLVFEKLSGEAGRKRCRELIQEAFSLGVRTLLTVPALLIVGFLLAWLVAGMVFEAFYSVGFWVLIAVIFWMSIPASGAVNTFLYLEIQKDLNPSAQTGGTEKTSGSGLTFDISKGGIIPKKVAPALKYRTKGIKNYLKIEAERSRQC